MAVVERLRSAQVSIVPWEAPRRSLVCQSLTRRLGPDSGTLIDEPTPVSSFVAVEEITLFRNEQRSWLP